jgi:trehalose monomycolate/heme transporter
MAGVFFAFALADSVIVKAVGIGIGIAVILDATVVRALLVPATMRLMGRWNWWAPASVARIGLRFRDTGERPVPDAGCSTAGQSSKG